MKAMAPKQPAPKKSLGQHFLVNPQICKRIAALLNPAPTDNILEIGPGPGCLTYQLLSLPHRQLVLIEKDNWWAENWAERKDLEIIHNDVLKFAWQSLEPSSPWKLTGNLPYNIASPLIWELMNYTTLWSRAVFMVQKEVAERICSQPGNRQYGGLSVWVQCHAQASHGFTLAPGAFRPPPKVESSVIIFVPRNDFIPYPAELAELIHILFQQRRKKTGTILKKSKNPFLHDALNVFAIADLRPEQLDCSQFLALSEFLGRARQTQLMA